MLTALQLAGALYKHKFETMETPTRTGTVTAVSTARQKWWPNQKFSDTGKISAVTVRLRIGYSCWQTVRCASSVTCRPKCLNTKTKSARPTWCLL